MKQQMLKTALLALTLTGAEMADAQPFTLNTSYKYPSTYTAGFSGHSASNSIIWDVNGDGGSGHHFAVGTNGSNGKIFLIEKDATLGTELDYQELDVQNYITSSTSTPNDGVAKMTVDEINHLLYITGSSNATTTPVPYLLTYNIAGTTPTISSGINLPIAGSQGRAKDIAIDANNNVYVLAYDDFGGGQYDIFKYDNTGSLLNAFYSISGQMLPYTIDYVHLKLKIDNTGSGNLYVCGGGKIGSSAYGGFVANLDLSLNYNTTAAFHTDPYGYQYDNLDVDLSTGNLAVIGFGGNDGYSWDVYSSGLGSLLSTGKSTNGGISTDADIPVEFMIDPCGGYIILATDAGWSTVYSQLSYIDRSNPSKWDVYHGSNAYTFDTWYSSGTAPYDGIIALHKDNSTGDIIVGGVDVANGYIFTAKFNNPSCTSWTNYENKHTTVTNVTTTNSFSVYPNPAQNELNISLRGDGAYTCRIMNSLGQLMASQNISDGKRAAHINIASLAAGQYYVQLQQADKTIGTTAFVKE